jgi:hypothetical protein
MIGLKISALIGAAFIAGAFITSPELRAYAANTVGSSDIIDESIQSVDIKNGQVKAADIATDAVSGDELKGVSKLLFGQCIPSETIRNTSYPSGYGFTVTCNITGVDADDSATATLNHSNACFEVRGANTASSRVDVIIVQDCGTPISLGLSSSIAVIVYDK